MYYEIEVLINNSWEKIAENSSGKMEWKPENFVGNIDLRCRATDLMNYSSWFNPPGEIFVDTVPPKIEVISPPSNAVFPHATKRIWINLTTNEKAICVLVNYNKTFKTKDGIHHYFT